MDIKKGDIVKVIDENLKTYGLKGIIMYLREDSCCIRVAPCEKLPQGNTFNIALKKVEKVSSSTFMVAECVFQNCTKPYNFKLYDLNIEKGDMVVVDTRQGFCVATVKNIIFEEECHFMPCKDVVCKVDKVKYNKRRYENLRKENILKQIDRLVKEYNELQKEDLL